MNKIRSTAIAALAFALFMVLTGSAAARDSNRDRLPDRWEKRHHLSLKVKQAKRDQDRDGLRNRGEFKAGMNPRDADSDDDGIEDGDENAGTIESFEGGVLTIKLFNGDTVKGEVTDETEIKCDDDDTAAAASGGDDPGAGRDDDDEGDDDGDRDDDDHGDRDDGDCDDEDGDHGDREDCGIEALTAGREVEEADLELADGKATFEEIELD